MFWRIFEYFDSAVLWLGRVAKGVAAGLVGVLFLILIAGVLVRPWSNSIFSSAFEVSIMLLWPIAFLGLANIWRTHGHVRFDLVLRCTHGRLHHMLNLCSAVAALIVALVLSWQSWVGFLSQYHSGSTTLTFRYPIWPLYSGVFIGSTILALELVTSVIREVRGLRSLRN